MDGLATLIDFKDGNKPEATFNLSATFDGQLKSAKRTFQKDSPLSVIIHDKIETNEKTNQITWQLITTAEVEVVSGGAILKQDGKTLNLENLSHPDFTVSVIPLYPAPSKLDKEIEGLKRLEIRIPAWTIENNKVEIEVRLSGE